MFKKTLVLQDPLEVREDMSKMAINHQFFLLVRAKKYEQAYAVGTMYLKYHPENQAVRKFCQFIEGNRQGLVEMVGDEEYESGDDESEEEDQEEDQDQDEDDVSVLSVAISDRLVQSAKSIKSVASSIGQTSKQPNRLVSNKENQKINPKNKWQHKCNNNKCPNKKKP